MTAGLVDPVFEKYNARWLSARDVASTFVPPPQFRDLLAGAHSVIIGPRGSGKTTLLKMLTQEALESWSDPQAAAVRRSVEFRGVFIGSDRAWQEQLLSVGRHQIPVDYRDVLANSAITTHVLRAFLNAAIYALRLADASVPPADEAVVVRELGEAWSIRPTLPSFRALRQALGARIVDLGKLGGVVAFASTDVKRRELLSEPYLHLAMRSAVSAAIDHIDDLFERRGIATRRWALLFDELEIAPARLLNDLFLNLRSTDPRLLFKLAVSPYNRDLEMSLAPDAPQAGHDYDEILLWHARKWDSKEFSSALWRKLVQKAGLGSLNPETVLGPSLFDTPVEEWRGAGTAYRDDSRLGERVRELARIDHGFAHYLTESKVDVSQLSGIDGKRRAETLRKLTPISQFRAEFLKERSSFAAREQRLRMMKKPPARLYSGASSIFTMLEGNPRWFIGVVGELLDEFAKRGDRRVGARMQTDAIVRTANRFRALLKTLPWRDTKKTRMGVLELVDRVAEYFSKRLLSEEFDPDPVGTFVIDNGVDTETHAALELALRQGALFLVPDMDSSVATASLIGKRCRITYLLAPHYGLPLRLGRFVSLSKILNSGIDGQQSFLEG